MNVATNKLIVASYVGLAIVVFVIAYFGYRLQVASLAVLEEGGGGEAVSASRLSVARRADRESSRERRRIAEQARTITQLRQLLEKRTTDLQAQNAQLERQTEDYRRLREESDRYLAMINELLQDDTPPAESGVDGPSASVDVQQTVAQNNELSEALANAQLELLQSRAEIADLEMAALGEHAKLTEATRTIVAAGPPAVPTLAAILVDENPALRAWAAETLGLMGPDAMDSVDALFLATEDGEANVRRAAQRALERIEESF